MLCEVDYYHFHPSPARRYGPLFWCFPTFRKRKNDYTYGVYHHTLRSCSLPYCRFVEIKSEVAILFVVFVISNIVETGCPTNTVIKAHPLLRIISQLSLHAGSVMTRVCCVSYMMNNTLKVVETIRVRILRTDGIDGYGLWQT